MPAVAVLEAGRSRPGGGRTGNERALESGPGRAVGDAAGVVVPANGAVVPEHVHADAVIGWPWSVFNDYDFEANSLGFRPRTVHAQVTYPVMQGQDSEGEHFRWFVANDREHQKALEELTIGRRLPTLGRYPTG